MSQKKITHENFVDEEFDEFMALLSMQEMTILILQGRFEDFVTDSRYDIMLQMYRRQKSLDPGFGASVKGFYRLAEGLSMEVKVDNIDSYQSLTDAYVDLRERYLHGDDDTIAPVLTDICDEEEVHMSGDNETVVNVELASVIKYEGVHIAHEVFNPDQPPSLAHVSLFILHMDRDEQVEKWLRESDRVVHLHEFEKWPDLFFAAVVVQHEKFYVYCYADEYALSECVDHNFFDRRMHVLDFGYDFDDIVNVDGRDSTAITVIGNIDAFVMHYFHFDKVPVWNRVALAGSLPLRMDWYLFKQLFVDPNSCDVPPPYAVHAWDIVRGEKNVFRKRVKFLKVLYDNADKYVDAFYDNRLSWCVQVINTMSYIRICGLRYGDIDTNRIFRDKFAVVSDFLEKRLCIHRFCSG